MVPWRHDGSHAAMKSVPIRALQHAEAAQHNLKLLSFKQIRIAASVRSRKLERHPGTAGLRMIQL